jgi:hypothetical protein
MAAARAIWFVVSLPFRLAAWLMWQARRAVFALANALIRAIGQRIALIAFFMLFVVLGVSLMTGMVECREGTRGCWRGAELLEGILIAGIGVALIVAAVRHVPNTRTPVGIENDLYRYRSEDWDLSWSSIATVVLIIGLIWIVLSITGRV